MIAQINHSTRPAPPSPVCHFAETDADGAGGERQLATRRRMVPSGRAVKELRHSAIDVRGACRGASACCKIHWACRAMVTVDHVASGRHRCLCLRV